MSTQQILDIIDNQVIFEDMTRELFNRIDKDNTKSLDKYELRTILIEFAETLEIKKPNDDDIENILSGFDSDGNCISLSYDEFKSVLNKLIKKIVNIIA